MNYTFILLKQLNHREHLMLTKLLMILLLEGFITISVEILTIRQLIPFYGGSIVITSVIIGIFLLFLALGYWRGGTYQKNYLRQLSRNFRLSLVWIGLGLSYTLIAWFFYLTVPYLHLSFISSLFSYLLIFLAPIVYWLGQTVPLTTNLFNQQQSVSRISGRALFLSTIGSFLGALLTSLVLFQYLGVAWTVFINCLLLFGLMLTTCESENLSFLKIVILIIVLSFIFMLNIQGENAQFKETNNYGNYQVIESPSFTKTFQINQSSSSQLTYENKAFPYIEYVRDLVFKDLQFRHKKILVIGAGGFTFTAAGTFTNEVTYVDIDPALKYLAEKYFLQKNIQGKFIGEDARQFLQKTEERFDVIISDVYSNQATIPPALLSIEYFQGIAQHLNPQGLMIANIIAAPLFGDDYSRTVFNTIHYVFPYCANVPLSWNQPLSNVIYICPNTSKKNALYSDDLNTATTDFFKSRRW